MTKQPNDKLWFRAKQYGWGWYPSTWQGWLTVAVLVSVLVIGSLVFFGGEPATLGQVVLFAAWFTSCVVCVVVISYKKGEKPRWRWGSSKKRD